MAAEYRIDGGAKLKLLTLATLFDIAQFLMPAASRFIFALAVVVFATLFAEHGALTVRASGARNMLRMVAPLLELFLPVLPTITLTVYIMIEVSRIADRALPDNLQDVVRDIRSKANMHKRHAAKLALLREGRILAKYAHGKGRRAARTALKHITNSDNT